MSIFQQSDAVGCKTNHHEGKYNFSAKRGVVSFNMPCKVWGGGYIATKSQLQSSHETEILQDADPHLQHGFIMHHDAENIDCITTCSIVCWSGSPR